jgi:hypothetical protein
MPVIAKPPEQVLPQGVGALKHWRWWERQVIDRGLLNAGLEVVELQISEGKQIAAGGEGSCQSFPRCRPLGALILLTLERGDQNASGMQRLVYGKRELRAGGTAPVLDVVDVGAVEMREVREVAVAEAGSGTVLAEQLSECGHAVILSPSDAVWGAGLLSGAGDAL